MDNRALESGAAVDPPTAPAVPSMGYPTKGNPATAVPASKGGVYWFYQIGEELRAIIAEAGIAPSKTVLTQVLQALGILFSRNIYTIAALRTVAPTNGRNIYLKAHTTEGDGGHGKFRGVTGAAPGHYVDNGGTIIVPTSGDGSAAWLRDYSGAVNVRWFGAVGDGVTNDTVPMLAFFTAAIASGGGHITAGIYLINEGVLKFDAAFTNKAWPVITTDGFKNVVFLASNTGNTPILEITNGTATSTIFGGWQGGFLGGITFRDTSGAVAADRHGIVLQGLQKVDFGYMGFDRLRGDGFHIRSAMYGGTNPDPYHVAFCKFDGLDADQCVGIGFNNDNNVGLTHAHIGWLRVTNGLGGGFRGLGTSTTIDKISMGGMTGWAIDDGNAQSLSRFKIGTAELDGCEYGIRINNAFQIDLGSIRFVHRYNVVGGVYWPKIALSFCYTASPSVKDVYGLINHRIEAGGIKANVGVFTELNSAGGNVNNVSLQYQFADNAGFGFVKTDYYSNLSANSNVKISILGATIVDQSVIPGFIATASSTDGEAADSADATADTFTVADNTDRWVTGMGVRLASSITLPAGLAPDTNYWLIIASSTTVKFASSYANALAGTAIDFTDAGSGIHTIYSTINTVAYASSPSRVAFNTEAWDRGGYYDNVNNWFVCPMAGYYDVSAQIHLTNAAIGTRLRMAIVRDVGGAIATLVESTQYSSVIGPETYKIGGVVALSEGYRVYLGADQLSGNLMQLTGGSTFNRFSAKAIGAR